MTEREYRALARDSYSSIKEFLRNRRKYHRKYVLQEDTTDEDDTNDAMTRGSLVDCLMFTPDDYEGRFAIANYTMPSGQMLTLTEELWKVTRRATNEEGRITRTFDSLLEEAYQNVAFDHNGNQVAFKQRGMNYGKVVERFTEEGLPYYEQLRQNYGRIIITPQEELAADSSVRELRTHFATRAIFNTENNPALEAHNQLVILWDYHGYPLKSMLDRVVVDHEHKTVQPYDLKGSWSVENFGYNYLKEYYYIQLATYGGAMLQWLQDMGYVDYELLPISFVVFDNCGGNTAPLVYETSHAQLQDAINGFTVNGRYYKGLRQAVDELKWHREVNLWNMSLENYRKRGKVALNYT